MNMLSSLDKKKVLIVATVPETVNAFLLPYMRELAASGCDVYLATGEGAEICNIDGIVKKYYKVPLTRKMSPLEDMRALLRIIRICRKNRFDLIHTHTLKASLIGQVAARIANIKARFETVHGTRYMPELPVVSRLVIVWSERIAAKLSQKVWVLNTEDFDFFENRIHIYAPKLELLSRGGIGVDLIKYRPACLSNHQRAEYKKRLNLPGDGFVVGFVGRPVVDKGILDLRTAWEKVVLKCKNIRLLIIACVLASDRSEELINIEELKTMKNTVVLTNRNDMPELYNCMDMLVLPSYREGFSRVILEACSCGLPVVTTDVRGCRDAIEDGETGFLVPPKAPGKLAEKITTLFRDGDLCVKMGAAARTYAEGNFDQRRIIDRINRTYQEYLSISENSGKD
ncbi:MAG: glycosyltransferase family 4 protein [Planctomycetota bacterium]